ncbi:MAG: alpha-galactosidase [Lachnospiraceae bacterium]|nr:alpha-galactosidase [Lachnospiraceae bacterium]
MAILFQEEKRIFTLQTKQTTYQMKVDDFGFLLHLYYGAKVSGEMDYLLTYYDRGFSGNPNDVGNNRTYSMDVLPQEYPTLGTGDYRNSAFVLRNHDESACCDLRYAGHEIREGKYELPGLPAVYAKPEEAQTLEIVLEDAVSKVRVRLLYGVLEDEDIITRSVKITNYGTEYIVVEKASSACLDFITGEYDLLSFYGRHAMERNLQRVRIGHGSQCIGSRRGTSSHQYNPAVIVAGKNTTEDIGDCYGMVFVYSGNFLCEAEQDQFDQTRILMGLQRDLFNYPLESGETLVVPETILCYSGRGFGDLSMKYHRCIRNHICNGARSRRKSGETGFIPRPVLVNSWEAAYFNFTGETIVDLAKDAAQLGIDMVVMDDGWFGKREDDNSGLGDWQVNEKKLGCSLGELVRRVNEEGVKFGIWIEPEMISEDSDLYREHPDWAMQNPGRNPARGRNQLVLDFSREDVREHIFDQICRVLDQGNIEYIKWDMNRSLTDFYSVETRQGKVSYDFVIGLYDFMEKLLAKYPQLMIEGCSGGGGRFDAGMMYYTPQIWCSDNTDAVDRLRIQYGTSFFYPMSTVSAHVSAVPNHQTGRITSLRTRGIVAMTGAFGYELSLGKLSAEEKEEIREQIRQYKEFEPLISTGDYYRLSNPFEDACAAWMFVSKDRKRVLLHVVLLENHGNMIVNYVRLKELLPDVVYEEEGSGKRYCGCALMQAGIPIPVEMGEYLAYQFVFTAKE